MGVAHRCLVPLAVGKAAGRAVRDRGGTPANRGNGHAPGKVPGGLPPYQTLKPRVARGLSGRALTGFNASSSVLVASKSTATSDYYRNADGSVTRRFATTPINYEASPGKWLPIETGLVPAAGGRWREKANSVQVSLASSSAAADLVSVGLGGRVSAELTLAGAAAVKPSVSGATATYRDALPFTDLVASAATTGLSQSLVLHSARAPSSWVFPLRLNGLRPVLSPDGSVQLVDAAGKTAAVIPRAYAYESPGNPRSGVPAASHPVSYRLTTRGGEPALVVTLDSAWLSAPGRKFPVTVDPSLYSSNALTTFADTTLPGDNSTSTVLNVGDTHSGKELADTFMQFPDQGLAGSGITVLSASLTMSVAYAATCAAERFDIAPVTQSWTPSGVTSYPGPAHSSSIGFFDSKLPHADLCGSAPDPAANPYEVTVNLSTATIQGWVNGTTPNDGLEAYASTADPLDWKVFDSDYTLEGPFLNLTYTGTTLPYVSAQTPADGSVVNTLTPLLTAYGKIDPSFDRNPKFDHRGEGRGLGSADGDRRRTARDVRPDRVDGPRGETDLGAVVLLDRPGLRRHQLLAGTGVQHPHRPGAAAGHHLPAVAEHQRARRRPGGRELHDLGDRRRRGDGGAVADGGAGLQLA